MSDISCNMLAQLLTSCNCMYLVLVDMEKVFNSEIFQKAEIVLGVASLAAFFSFLMYDGIKQLNLVKEMAEPNIAHTSNYSSQHN